MKSEIRTFSYPGGEIQRVQMVRFEDWSALDFLHPVPTEAALGCFSEIYNLYLVPARPWMFGTFVMFTLPDHMEVPFSRSTKEYGHLADDLTVAAAALQQGVTFVKDSPQFASDELRIFWTELERRNCLRIIRGQRPATTIIPLCRAPGYLTESEREAVLKVNASFFIMDMFDCATIYDNVGTPFGLAVKDGTVKNPPLFGREALMVRKNGGVSIETPDVRDLGIEICGTVYRYGINATVYSRPEFAKAPKSKGKQLVIVGCRVAAVCEGGNAAVPASGFVLDVDESCTVQPGDEVTYRGMEDILFGIQVGNSIVRNGEKTTGFRSRFYDINAGEPVPFPPSLYPMDFDGARAARIALGAGRDGKPMLLWAEGAGKLGYMKGQDSCGASLSEMAEICSEVGMVNAVNLDGGGSAQILLENRRSLLISDRKRTDHSEAERPVPLGLVVR